MLSDYEKREKYRRLSELYTELHSFGDSPEMEAYVVVSSQIDLLLEELGIFPGDLPLSVFECIEYFHNLAEGDDA